MIRDVPEVTRQIGSPTKEYPSRTLSLWQDYSSESNNPRTGYCSKMPRENNFESTETSSENVAVKRFFLERISSANATLIQDRDRKVILGKAIVRIYIYLEQKVNENSVVHVEISVSRCYARTLEKINPWRNRSRSTRFVSN